MYYNTATIWKDTIEKCLACCGTQAITFAQDKLPRVKKSIFMLYKYRVEVRSWVGKQSVGTVTIYPGPILSAPSSNALVPSYSRPAGVF
jgi:hypothetical protein